MFAIDVFKRTRQAAMNWYGNLLAFVSATILLALSGSASAGQRNSSQSGNSSLSAQGSARATWGDSSGPWIAYAHSKTNTFSGFVYGQSERAAENAALKMCGERGGGECEIEFTQELGCAAVVSRPDDSAWALRTTSVSHAVSAARRICGRDCEVIWSGCTTPRSRRQGG